MPSLPDPLRRCAGGRALFALLLVTVAMGCTSASKAQPQPADAIGFVRLALTDSTLTLLEASSVPGRLKAPRSRPAPEALTFDVLAAGRVVWTETLEDPLLERVEYVDDAGQLRSRIEPRTYAEITLRMPVVAPRQVVQLYRTDASNKQAARALIGEVVVTF